MGQLISYLDRLYSIKLKKIKTLRKHFLQNKFNQLTLFFFLCVENLLTLGARIYTTFKFFIFMEKKEKNYRDFNR